VPAGRVSGADIASIDWFATAAKLAGAQLGPATTEWLRGVDASALLLGTAAKALPRAHPLVWDYRAKMLGNCYHRSPMMAILRDDVRGHEGTQWKLLMHPDRSRLELFNLSDSVAEIDSLAASHPDVVALLAPQLQAWEDSMPVKAPPGSIHLNAGCVAATHHHHQGAHDHHRAHHIHRRHGAHQQHQQHHHT
jgi:arylsulfatase A-like enzyme